MPFYHLVSFHLDSYMPTVIVKAAPKISSIGKIGTTPRGSGIDESQLPLRYRRRPIDEEEIAIINVRFLKVVYKQFKNRELFVHTFFRYCCS